MKIKLSLVAILLNSTFALAGGDFVTPVEPVIEVPQPEVQKAFYVGAGYSCEQLTGDTPDQEFRAMTALSLNAGYIINEYLAVEGRYTTSLGDVNYKTWNQDYDADGSSISNVGIYLKPQYSFGTFAVYGLAGYGQVMLDDGKESYEENGFQYGLGTSVTVMENTNIFVDYRRLYDDNGFDALTTQNQDTAANSYTLGVNYLF